MFCWIMCITVSTWVTESRRQPGVNGMTVTQTSRGDPSNCTGGSKSKGIGQLP